MTVSLEISLVLDVPSPFPPPPPLPPARGLLPGEGGSEWWKKRKKKVDPSLMPRRTGHGWNFKQRHVVELGISGLFCSIRP